MDKRKLCACRAANASAVIRRKRCQVYFLRDITVPGVMELTGGTYDEAGNLIARTEDTGDLALAQFTYDGIDRLDTADGAFGSRDYDLDRNGNRNKLVSDGVTTTFTYPRNRYRKHDNQPTRDTFWTYTHDANGSITAKTSTVGAPDLGYEFPVWFGVGPQQASVQARYILA